MPSSVVGPMRLLLADDETRVRFALRVLLLHRSGIDLVGEASNAAELLETLSRESPDVVLLDWELPGSSGSQLLRDMRSIRPRLPIIALSGRPENQLAALSAGADAFVSKADPPERLISALGACSGNAGSRTELAYAAC